MQEDEVYSSQLRAEAYYCRPQPITAEPYESPYENPYENPYASYPAPYRPRGRIRDMLA